MEWSGDGFGKGVQQQLVRVKMLARCRVIGAESTQTVMLPFRYAFDKSKMNVAITSGEFVMPDLLIAIEQRHVHMGCGSRMHGDVGAAISQGEAKRKRLGLGISNVECQVITVGAVRPVCASMPAALRA